MLIKRPLLANFFFMTSQEIRQIFLDFFRKKNHHILPSSPITLKDDPTLIFVNSGMNTFKDYFIGKKKILFSNIASTQKCLRVSGKHNDLEEVGNDYYHHTMFEMLGNWSFNYCFKEQAIEYAWELLTEVYKIPIENIYVTLFAGDSRENVSLDKESRFFWEKKLKKERIITCGKKYNLWEMSNTGPCGPCSEIHIDLRSHKEKRKKYCKNLINKDHPEIIELWNIVFIEFLRPFNGNLEILAERHIDTGIGFERLCRVLQHKTSNYDTDIFSSLIRKIEDISYLIYGKNPHTDIAIRVIIDHIRAISFAIADGQNPSNSGAGYVIRRIIRRAVNYGFRFILKKKVFLYQLVDDLVKEMSRHFPELKVKKKYIEKIIYNEELYFFKTISNGIKRLENIIQETKIKKLELISGIKVFELFDTYGFPMDLSRLIVTEHELLIDEEGFEKELDLQRNRSRNINYFNPEDWIIIRSISSSEDIIFYDKLNTYIYIDRYRRVTRNKYYIYHIIFNITPFSPEKEGQVSDAGIIENEKEIISIIKIKKENGIFVHITKNLPKYPEKIFRATVNKLRRKNIEKNHSAIHLLFYALYLVINDFTQKRSYLDDKRIIIEFLSSKKITNYQIQSLEGIVQEIIDQNFPLKKYISLYNDNKTKKNIRFGPIKELCDGFHVKSTGNIGILKIISVSSIGDRIRRIEAITSLFVNKHLNNIQNKYQVIFEEKNNIFILNKKKYFNIHVLFKAKYNDIYILISEKIYLDFFIIKSIIFELRNQNIELLIIFFSILENIIYVAISNNITDIYGINACKIIKKLTLVSYYESSNKELALTKAIVIENKYNLFV